MSPVSPGTGRLAAAWQQYANDNNDRLVNNYTIPETFNTISNGQNDTWALNVLDWTTNQRNTNRTYIQNSKLFPYLQGDMLAFKCPADLYLSSAQRAAGWTARARSYSMNAFMGKTSSNDQALNNGQSTWVTGKRQFLKSASIPYPANTFVFVDEHPDSINDGFFIEFPQQQWADLPASYHNGGCGFGFADGSAEIHIWQYAATKVPVRYTYTAPTISPSTSADFVWISSRMTVDPATLAINRRASAAEIAWSALSTNYVLEANSDLSTVNWMPVNPQPTADYGTKSARLDTPNSASFFRLRRY